MSEPCDTCEGEGCEACRPDLYRMEHVKWIADGASSLSEASARLRAFADELDRLDQEGWILPEPVDDGFIHMTHAQELLETDED